MRALYRLFPWIARASDWFDRRLTAHGRLLFGLAVASGLFSVDLRQTLAYQIWVLACALLASAAAASVRWRPAIEVRRVLPAHLTDGGRGVYWFEITNRGTRIERDLVIRDRIRQPALSYPQFQRLRDTAGEPRRNWFDRAVGFPRWLEARRRARGLTDAQHRVPAIAPGRSARIRVDTTCTRRGWIHFTAVELLRPDPLGLVHARHEVPLPGAVLALPRRHPVPAFALHSERRYQRGGVSLALAVGDAQEFAGLRDYRPGDQRRHIHWRSFAKTGTLIVKEYHDEYFDRHALVIDCHVAPAATRLFEGIVSVGASLAARARPRDAILDLLVAGGAVLELGGVRGAGDADRALAFLAELQPAPHGDFAGMAELLRQRAPELASVVLVLADYDAQRAAVVAALRARGVAVLALQVVTERRPAEPGSDRPRQVRLDRLGEDLLGLSMPAKWR